MIRAERNGGASGTAPGSRVSTPAREGAAIDDPDAARKRQEDILQARHEKLATDANPGERRSSSSRREKETGQERADRKAREKAEDRERDKDQDKARDDAGSKRKREEAVSRVDGTLLAPVDHS